MSFGKFIQGLKKEDKNLKNKLAGRISFLKEKVIELFTENKVMIVEAIDVLGDLRQQAIIQLSKECGRLTERNAFLENKAALDQIKPDSINADEKQRQEDESNN